MQTAGMILNILGLIVGMGGGIWLLVVAFQESVGWGLACMLIPCAALYFVFTHWDEAKLPFLVNIGGAGLSVIAALLMGGGTQ
jgi:hypothetical protein